MRCLGTQLIDQVLGSVVLEVVSPELHCFIMENLGFAVLNAATGLNAIQFVLHCHLINDCEELCRVLGSHSSFRVVDPIRLADLVFVQRVLVRNSIRFLLFRPL